MQLLRETITPLMYFVAARLRAAARSARRIAAMPSPALAALAPASALHAGASTGAGRVAGYGADDGGKAHAHAHAHEGEASDNEASEAAVGTWWMIMHQVVIQCQTLLQRPTRQLRHCTALLLVVVTWVWVRAWVWA